MAQVSAITRGVSDFSFILGKGLLYAGGASLFVMACVGTLSIDLVLLSYAEKKNNAFLTGFILGSLFSGPRIDPVPLLIASPITSAIAVGLSIALGVPSMGAAIAAGWAVAAMLLFIGYGLQEFSKSIDPEHTPEPGFNMSFV